MPDKFRLFGPRMDQAERKKMTAILSHITDELEAANITYWLTDGTLIDAYRHHGVVPWDDDLDIRIRRSDLPRLEALHKRRLSDEYVIHYDGRGYLKLYPLHELHGTYLTRLGWRFPFIDVWLSDENETHVWNVDNNEVIDPRSSVYPLRRRPFGNLSLWTPRDTAGYLRRQDAVEWCESSWYSHKYENWLRRVLKVACRELYPYLPFVFRNESRDEGKIVEVLKVGDRVISTIELDTD